MPLGRASRWALSFAVVSTLAGCGPKPPPPQVVARPIAAEAPIVPVAVADDAFADSVQKLLRDGAPGPGRTALLAGVVGRQLAHAGERFEAQQRERGLSSVTGALYLLRAGEVRREMLTASDAALAAAYAALAAKGDEGRSLALLTLRSAALAEGTPGRKDTDDHLAALRDWLHDTRTGGQLELAGRDQRVEVGRALLEPTTEALAAARDATVAWIDRAALFNQEARSGMARPRREDALEAFRAFRSGAEALAALYLKQGDAAGALAEIDKSSAKRMIAPSLYQRIERAAAGGDAVAWRELLSALLSPERDPEQGRPDPRDDPELQIDPELLRAAVWGTAVEAYRRDPTALDVAMPLAAMLMQLGMPEVAPAVMADAVAAHPDGATVSNALGGVLGAIAREDDAEDAPSARRIYRAAGPLLSFAEQPQLAGRVQPSPARIRLVMGTVETRAGDLAAARPLLEAAVSAEPTIDAAMTLAAIERQAGSAAAALAHLARALASPEAKTDPIAAGEAHYSSFEVLRESGQADRAPAELAASLASALDARARARDSQGRTRAERLLAKVLDRYADAAGSARAMQRAYASAGRDRRQVTGVVLDATSRAFLRKDAASARAAVARALDAELKDDDLVYAALWLLLCEKEAKLAPDGAAARALATIHDDGRWPGKLAAWGLGRLKDHDLVAAARTPNQKTEATFYTAIARRLAGDAASSEAALREVVRSPTIDLVEVQLARELLAAPARTASIPLPGGAQIP